MNPFRRAYPGRAGRIARRVPRRPATARLDGRRGASPRAAAPLALLLAAALALGCEEPERAGDAVGAAVATAPATPPGSTRGYEIRLLPSDSLRLTGAAGSLIDLVEIVERGIAERDTARLFDLMITEREYREIVYPALPAAHPPINASFETIWVTHFGDAYRGMKALLRMYGGRNVQVHDLRFEKPNRDFVNYVLHETSRVDVTVDGLPILDTKLFGSVVQVGDQWKVLSYPDR